MRATLKDIAKKCNVSITAVSLVLNNKPNRVSEPVRALILEAAEKLNYIPNQVAVGLVKGRTNTIGLITPDISNLFFSEMSKSIEDEAVRHNYTVVYGNSGDTSKRELSYIKTFTGKKIDGIILIRASQCGPAETEELIETVNHTSTPLILIDRDLPCSDFKKVMLDHKKGAYLATKHLLDLGHKKIGCLTGPYALSSARDRVEGYKEALSSSGIDFDKSLIFEGNYYIDTGFAALPYFLKKGVTAIFCFNDMMAFGIYKSAHQAGIRIPDDISIVGFDNSFFCELLETPLTSVSQPTREMARDATSLLISEIEGTPLDFPQELYPPSLIIRQSTRSI